MATIPNDPLFKFQLWLRNTNAGQYDLNIIDVWDDYTGDGIRLTAVDLSYDLAHDDIDDNVNTDIDWDYENNDADPNAAGRHGHGILGIMGAEAWNGYGGVGVAWNAELVAYHGYWAFSDAAGLGPTSYTGSNPNVTGPGADVINFSVTTDHFVDLDHYDQLEDVTAFGRGGLGTNFVKANGNFRISGWEGTAEKGNTSEYSISAAALRLDGWVTDSSTPGANLLVAAFADDLDNEAGVVTVQPTGQGGLRKDFGWFQGTSAAAAETSGVIALMLEANPDLGWRDIQTILAYSARHVGSGVGEAANTGAPSNGAFEIANQLNGATWFWNGATNWNGGALHFSNDYGFGLLDAKTAVRLAETWTRQSTTANELEYVLELDPGTVNPEETLTAVAGQVPVDMIVEYISIDVDFDADNVDDLELILISPDGTRVEMLKDHNSTDAYSGNWGFGTNAFRGTIIPGVSDPASNGNWQVLFANDDGSANGAITITDIDVTFRGRGFGGEAHIFTEEFSEYAGFDGHGTDFDGGVVSGAGIINAAAVSSDTTLDLLGGTGSIDGVAVTLNNIAEVYTGDGKDVIVGDTDTKRIFTGFGNDTITAGATGTYIDGGKSQDSITGGAGDDTINDGVEGLSQGVDTIDGSGGNDLIIVQRVFSGSYAGGEGEDTLDIRVETDDFTGSNSLDLSVASFTANGSGFSGFEHVLAGTGQHNIIGTDGANLIAAGQGDDTAQGGAGDDTIHGDDLPVGMARLNAGGVSDQYFSSAPYDLMPTGAFTVEWFFRGDAEAASGTPFVSYAADAFANAFLVYGATGGTIEIVVNDASIDTGIATSTVFDGAVHRMSVSVNTGAGDDGRVSLYIDGVLAFTGNGGGTDAGMPVPAGGTFIIGQDQDSPGGGFDMDQVVHGAFGDVRVWSFERGEEAIAKTAFSTFGALDPIENPALATNWQLDPGTGQFTDLLGETALNPTAGSGSISAERYTHNGGNDRLSGGLGDDTMFGGAGTDTAVYDGTLSDYDFTENPDGSITVTDLRSGSPNGTDTVHEVEIFEVGGTQFSRAQVLTDNAAPVATPDAPSGDEDTVVAGQVTATDADGDTVTFAKASDPANGSVTVNSDGTYSYTPNADYNGSDSFDVTADDGNGGTDTVTVNVTVNAVNDAPTITSEASATVPSGTTAALDVDATDAEDAEGSGLVYAITGGADQAAFQIDADTGEVSFAAAPDFSNPTDADTDNVYEVEVSVTDSGALADNQDLFITVTDALPQTMVACFGFGTDNSNRAFYSEDGELVETINLGYYFNHEELGQTGVTIRGFSGSDDGGRLTLLGTGLGVRSDPSDSSAQRRTVEGTETVRLSMQPAGEFDDAADISAALGNVSGAGGLSFAFYDDDVLVDQTTVAYTGDPISYELAGADFDTVVIGATDTLSFEIRELCFTRLGEPAVVVGQPPVAADDSASVAEDGTVDIDLLDNDSDPDGDPLTAIVESDPANGSVTIDENGLASYTPDPDFNGQDSFTYQLSDGNGGTDTATVTVDVTPVAEAPTITSSAAFSVTSGADVAGDVQTQDDDDSEGSGLTYAITGGADQAAFDIDASTGVISFITPPDAENPADADEDNVYALKVTVTDSDDLTDTQDIDITVNDISSQPIVTCIAFGPDSTNRAFYYEDDELVDTISLGYYFNNKTLGSSGMSISGDSGSSDTGRLSMLGKGLGVRSDPSDGSAQRRTVDESETVRVQMAETEALADANDITATLGNVSGSGGLSFMFYDDDVLVDQTTIDFAGSPVSYALAGADFDEVVIGATGTLAFEIQELCFSRASTTPPPVGNPPVAADDAATVAEDGQVVIDILQNDDDPDGDPLTATVVSDPENGTVEIDADGDATYTPNPDFFGEDSFSYEISDGNGGTDTAVVTVTVTAENDAPQASDDSYATLVDEPLNVDATGGVLANDSDADGDTLTATVLSDPENGSLTLNGDGSFDYTPDEGFVGTDSFTYEVGDGNGTGDSAQVSISVDADAPAAGIAALFDFTDQPGQPRSVTYSENDEVLSTVSPRYFADQVFVSGANATLTSADPNGTAKLSFLGQALGVRSYSTDDVSQNLERRTLDDEETITLQLGQSDTAGDASDIAFTFTNAGGAGTLNLDFWNDGALVHEVDLAIDGTEASYDLPGLTEFDRVDIGVSSAVEIEIQTLSLTREDLTAIA